jgi:photosystem II stability/assembly factor-like uncharacterized protein
MAIDEDDDGDVPVERQAAFLQRLGMPYDEYNAALERCIADALAAPPDNGPAGSPGTVPWVGFGGRNIGGRVRCLAQDPSVPTTLYAGAAHGGVFRSLDAGDTWEPIGAAEHAFPVGAIAVAPGDPNRVYVGSGEFGVQHRINGATVVAEEFIVAGRGFYRCDAGVSPPAMIREVASELAAPGTAGAANCFQRIAVDPGNRERCWIASSSGLWRREPGAGPGQPPVFNREPLPPGALPAASTLGSVASDVLLVSGWNAAQPTLYRVYAAIAGLGIYRGTFDPGNAAAGTTWEPAPLANGLPGPSSAAGGLTWDQIRLTVCRSQPRHLYAIADDGTSTLQGVYHSGDGGDTWAACTVPPIDDAGRWQANWNLVVEVHPDNPALVITGAVNVARSTDFGVTWQMVIDWTNFDAGDPAQHADQHDALFDVADPRRLWVCNDAGISMTTDIVGSNPITARSWRKRSYGIQAAQFNDIAVHPSYPSMMGGGLQDNGTYVTLGGETWYYVRGGDGAQMAFRHRDPRTFFVPAIANIGRVTVIDPAAAPVGVRSGIANADLAPPNDVFATTRAAIEGGIAAAHGQLFIAVVESDPGTRDHFMLGRQAGGAYVTTDGGANWNALGYAAALFGGGDVASLAYGRSGGLNADRWVGTTQGVVLRGRQPFAAANWIDVTAAAAGRTPLVSGGDVITRIVVHPADDHYVAVSTAAKTAPHQGQVFLSLDRGERWANITGLAAVGAPAAGAPALLALPRGPVTSLAFDPQAAAAAEQTLFAGTLAGVFVIRNLPRRRAPPVVADVPAFNPRWFGFNGVQQPADPAPQPQTLLPLTLANDLRVASLPRSAPADAGLPESFARHRLVAALYGRGMYTSDITRGYPAAIGPGGLEHRLYLRQTVVEDGMTYPRPTPAILNAAPADGGAQPKLGGDPRLPLAPPPFPLLFTDRDGIDIRIDNAPFRHFDGAVDGVEFDQALHTKPLRIGERNLIYVQVHTRGWRRGGVVDVDLYFAEAPDPGAPNTPAVANAAPLPDLHADFWAHFESGVLPPPAAATNPPRATWQRVATRETLFKLAPNQPEVARFEWTPPVTLGRFVALLALCSSIFDRLPANPPTVMATLVRNERRAAFRVVRTQPFVPDLFIRDGLDDDGRLGGVAFGGRSPDIIVVAAAPPDPAATFNDLGDDRAADRVQGNGGNNVVYVRVHNRKDADTAADVELFWALPNLPVSAAPGQASPPFDVANWQVIAPVDAVNITVPARGTRLARFDFSAAPAPEAGIPNAIAFIALIRSRDSADPSPVRTEVNTQPEFWRLFLELANSNNAALRALRYA